MHNDVSGVLHHPKPPQECTWGGVVSGPQRTNRKTNTPTSFRGLARSSKAERPSWGLSKSSRQGLAGPLAAPVSVRWIDLLSRAPPSHGAGRGRGATTPAWKAKAEEAERVASIARAARASGGAPTTEAVGARHEPGQFEDAENSSAPAPAPATATAPAPAPVPAPAPAPGGGGTQGGGGQSCGGGRKVRARREQNARGSSAGISARVTVDLTPRVQRLLDPPSSWGVRPSRHVLRVAHQDLCVAPVSRVQTLAEGCAPG
jgi:hypothetical protein